MKRTLRLPTRISIFVACMMALAACSDKDTHTPDPEPDSDTPSEETVTYAKGADISWVTEMESKNYKFYNTSGTETECTALMKELGFNAVRYRVWVNPSNNWCNKADVVAKAKRAQALGLKIMIDFHYSDTWADPGKQTVPSAWSGHSADQLSEDVASHTRVVLSELKNAGIDVAWVQVGNEVTNGFLWETCKVSGSNAANFVKCFNAGAAAAKAVFPDTKIILHIDNGWKTETLTWFYNLMKTAGANYDIIGLSLYPSYWDDSTKSYPDWSTKTKACVTNITTLHNTYGKNVMICEFGMPETEPAKAKAALQYLLDNTKSLSYCSGVFLWEPESENARNGYAYGAFTGGKPTAALDPIKD